MIFSQINIKLIDNINKNFYYLEEVITFEKEINDIINEQISNKILIEKYTKLNNTLLDVEPFSEKSIIMESEPCEIYSNDKYPEMEYFTKQNLPNKEDFINKFNYNLSNKSNYPITNMIINNKKYSKIIKLLKYLPIINDICNYMIKFCSYKYSREEAKQIKIENINLERDKKDLIKKFCKIYKQLRPYIKKFDNNDLDKGFNNLEKESYLSNFCVDIHENNYGMVLAGIYRKMIDLQNYFINTIINSTNDNLKNYANLFIIKIMIQDCNKDDIVYLPSFDDDNEDENEIEENELNEINEEKDINYDKDENKINLMKIIISNSYHKTNYIMEYNFESIEDTLASLMLPKIKSFYSPETSEKYLRTVIYQYEGFRGNSNNIITDYKAKYQQRNLSDIELNIVISYILKEQNNKSFNINNLLLSLQILIDIILGNNYNKNDSLCKIMKNIDDNSNISVAKNFFKKIETDEEYNDSLFTVECLIDLMNIFEMLCWDKIKNHLDKDYSIDINDDIKLFIKKFFNKNKIKISKELLCTAIRRFISRYLIGKKEENKINSKNNLYHYLDKNELWPDNLKKNEIFKEELKQLFTTNKSNYISVGHSLKLYEYLGGDLFSLEELIKKKKEETKKNDNKNNNSINIHGEQKINEKYEMKNLEYEEKTNDEFLDDEENEEDEEELSQDEGDQSQEYEEFGY